MFIGGDVTLANNKAVFIKESGGTARTGIYLSSSDEMFFGPPAGSIPLIFRPGATEKMRLTAAGDLSLSGDLTAVGGTFSGDVTTGKLTATGLVIGATNRLFLDGEGNTYIHERVADEIELFVGGAGRVRVGTGGATFFQAVEIDGDLNHDGSNIGFFGTAPAAKQTGVAVTAAGIHAALVTYGLIT